MTLKRIVLSVLTLLVAWVMSQSLISSFSEPQVGNQLQLYQTDLIVQASEWDGSGLPETEIQQFRNAVFGKDAIETANEQYQEVRKDAATSLTRVQQQIETVTATDTERKQSLTKTAQSQQILIDQIDLRLGMVHIQQNEVDKALNTWEALASRPSRQAQAAAVLADLWKTPPVIGPQTQATVESQLKGWFRYKALDRLYTLENKAEQNEQLTIKERQFAEQTLIQLSIVGLLPSLGGLLGSALLIALIGQRLLRGNAALLAIEEEKWQVPWNWEVVWLVIVGGFLFTGQLALPLILQVGLLVTQSATLQPAAGMLSNSLASMGSDAATGLASAGFTSTGFILGLTNRGKALYSLVFYLLMAASTLGVLYWAIKEYLPLSKEWFQIKLAGRWPLWGFGGYFVALPLMLAVSLLNQQIWQGQGGNNPILQIVLEERDPIALGMFLFTAAIAAPVFEEVLFRGFLLPSLTRYMSTWGAIGLSSLIFSVAHLSFSEVLPLTVLGAILGFVYAKTQNLMASILLHSTWNSITMIGLFLLG
ncbi:MAG: type II CAAX endopeptidase family protein, partial [Cyanobacteria bacterium J06560_2]